MDHLAKGLYAGKVIGQGIGSTAKGTAYFAVQVELTDHITKDGSKEPLRRTLTRNIDNWFSGKALDFTIQRIKHMCSLKGIPYTEDPLKWNLSAPGAMDLTGTAVEVWCSGQDAKGYDDLAISVPHAGGKGPKPPSEDAGAALALRGLLKGSAAAPSPAGPSVAPQVAPKPTPTLETSDMPF